MHTRQRRQRLLLVSAGVGVVGAAILAAATWLSPASIKYTVERAPSGGERKIRFSDGTLLTADGGSRLRVLSSNRRGARLRVEEGSAHLRVAARPRADWVVEAGPYSLAVGASELDVSWSAAQTSLSVALLSGTAVMHGPFQQRDDLRLRGGETLVARASDGFWRVGRGRHPEASGDLQARALSLSGAAPAGLPSRLSSGPSDFVSMSALTVDGHCARRSEREARPPRPEDGGPEPWAWLGGSGCLGYLRDARGNRLPDFSFAGYRGGGVSLPLVPRARSSALVTPGKGGDDTPRVQAALDAMAARPADASGFRGVVELASGTFTLRGSLRLMQSGVVLRGQGAEGAHRTLLRAVGVARPLVIVGPEDDRTVSGPTHRIVEDYVPVGARSFQVESTEGLRVDDEVVVQRPFSAKWLAFVGMDRPPSRRPEGEMARRGAPVLAFERRIVAIDGNRVTLDAPLTNALEREFGDATISKYTFPQRVARIGIERLASDADFDPSSDLGDGMFAEVNAVMNAWLREVRTARYESGLVSLEHNSKWITVEDAFYEAGPEAPSWARGFVLGGQQNLILRSRSVGAHHALGTMPRSAGPNAVVDFTAIGRAATLTPNRWTAGLLLDNVRVLDPSGEPSGEISMRMRDGGRGRGWSAANCVVWNSEAGRFSIDSPPTAQNWVIGSAGEAFGNATFEVSRVPRPESLYRAQVAERLGEAGLSALAR